MDLIFLSGVACLILLWCLEIWLLSEVSSISELPDLQWGRVGVLVERSIVVVKFSPFTVVAMATCMVVSFTLH